MRKLFLIALMSPFAVFGATLAGQASVTDITTGTGWVHASVSTTSDVANFNFSLSGAGIFSLVDGFNQGDIYTITGDASGTSNFSLPSIAITLGLGDTAFDQDWTDTSFSRFQVALGAGSYSLAVQGNCSGGCPAGFGVRTDLAPVPLPASGLLLIGALVPLALRRRRRA